MILQRVRLIGTLLLAAPPFLPAADPGAATTLPAEAQQFDFWVGDWDVQSPDGKLQGHSKIERVAGGRGLLEQWSSSGANAITGRSLNAWNSEKKRWQQFWIGSDGEVLELSGGIEGGKMVMSAEHATATGTKVSERITWTPNSDGSVRQLWEQSSDAGKSWKIVFDGRYTSKSTKVAGGTGPSRTLLYLFW